MYQPSSFSYHILSSFQKRIAVHGSHAAKEPKFYISEAPEAARTLSAQEIGKETLIVEGWQRSFQW
jgi:hypothetical protein